jgi:hypothetical protein
MFGVRVYNVVSRAETPNGVYMQAQHLGWPLPVIELKQKWWNWNDSALNGPEPDPAPTLMPAGLLIIPLLLGGGVWLVTVLPAAVFVLARR